MDRNQLQQPLVTPILLFGKDGQVGWQLQLSLAPLGQVKAVDRAECDLSDPDALRALIRAEKPKIIVNAAAYTAVDKAEAEPELAHCINADAPALMAEEAKALGALLVHLSLIHI